MARASAPRGAGAGGSAPVSQTLVRGLDLLEQLANGPKPLSTLAGQMGLSRSTIHRLATALLERRYLNLQPERGYSLGPKLMELGWQARGQIDLLRLAEPVLQRLAAGTGELAVLAVRQGQHVLLADLAAGSRAIAPALQPGGTGPLAGSALGLSLLMDEAPAQRERLIAKLHAGRAAEVLGMLREAAASGVVVDCCVLDAQICAMAAPVRDSAGHVIAAIGLCAAGSYATQAVTEAGCAAVRAAAGELAAGLGWQAGHGPAQKLLDATPQGARKPKNTGVTPGLPPSQPAFLPANEAAAGRERVPAADDPERTSMKGRPA